MEGSNLTGAMMQDTDMPLEALSNGVDFGSTSSPSNESYGVDLGSMLPSLNTPTLLGGGLMNKFGGFSEMLGGAFSQKYLTYIIIVVVIIIALYLINRYLYPFSELKKKVGLSS